MNDLPTGSEGERTLARLNASYGRLETLRGQFEARLRPGPDGRIVQPNIVEAIERLTENMEELVRQSEAVLDNINGSST